MTNQHQHNPATYISLRIGSFALFIVGFIAAGYVTLKSVTGELYNPLTRLPAWIFNYIVGRPALPYSMADFKGMGDTFDVQRLGEAIGSAVYLLGMSALTFWLVFLAFIYISNFVYYYALKYKLGAEGAAAYKKEQQKKADIKHEEYKSLSELEAAQREHYFQWKKTFKSELSYDEWKSRFSGVINHKD